MKKLLANIYAKIKDKGITIVDLSFLVDNSWFYITAEIITKKTVYIFRPKGELLISEDGDVRRAKWENLVHSTNSIIVDIQDKITLYNIVYLTSEYLLIQKDGTEEIKVFIKQKRYVSKISKELYSESISFVYNDLNVLLNENNQDEFIKHANTYSESLKQKKIKEIKIEETTENRENSTEISISKNQNNPSQKSISKTGKKKPLNYNFKSSCHEKEFTLKNIDGKWGYMDKDNNVVIDFNYDDAFPFSEGLACVQIGDEKGFIDRNGVFAISPQFDSATYFKNGISNVSIGEQTFDIDKDGNRLNDNL